MQDGRTNALHDKHNPRGVIVVRPLLEVNGRMNNVLDAMKDDRPGRIGDAQ